MPRSTKVRSSAVWQNRQAAFTPFPEAASIPVASCVSVAVISGNPDELLAPAKGIVEQPVLDEAADAADAGITAAVDLGGGQARGLVGAVQFPRPPASVPSRPEARQRLPDLVAADAVAALVRSAAARILDAAAGN